MNKKRYFTIWILTLAFILTAFSPVFAGVSTTADAYGPADCIYVAGNPDAYSVEYYDEVYQEFRGIMTRVLEVVSKETGYNFVYLNGSPRDTRLRCAENRQVEIVSAVHNGETDILSHITTGGAICENAFSITLDTGETYSFGYTEIASRELAEAVESVASKITESQLLDFSIEVSRNHNPADVSKEKNLARTNAMLCLLVIGVLLIVLSRRRASDEPVVYNGKNEVQHINTMKYKDFEERFVTTVNENTFPIYYLFYLSFDTEQVAQKYGVPFMERQLKFGEEVIEEHIKGDDFSTSRYNGIVVCRSCGSPDTAKKWAAETLEELNGGMERGNISFFRCGIFAFPQVTELDTAIKNALQGYKVANDKRSDVVFCDNKLLANLDDMISLSGEIQRAFDEHEFQLYLQFIIDATTGKISGGEALSRWMHPKRGLLHPGKYLDALFSTGQIRKHDLYIFEEVCKCLTEWKAENLNLSISCNFARVSIDSADFVEELEKIADKYDFVHGNLIIEITEDVIESNRKQAFRNVKMAQKYGFRIALDDVGSGYTRFSDLKDYPVNIFKIDRAILLQADTEKGKNLLQAMIQMATMLGVEVLCEGIETLEQCKMLKSMGCKYLQGFYFFHPMAYSEIKPGEIMQRNNELKSLTKD